MKNKAKYYIYRNLHKDCFSIKHKGIVIAHAQYILAHGVQYKVNQKGREQVLREGRKQVHAYVVCDRYTILEADKGMPWSSRTVKDVCDSKYNTEVYYNPYKQDSFTVQGSPIKHSEVALLGNNKVWLSKKHAERHEVETFCGMI